MTYGSCGVVDGTVCFIDSACLKKVIPQEQLGDQETECCSLDPSSGPGQSVDCSCFGEACAIAKNYTQCDAHTCGDDQFPQETDCCEGSVAFIVECGEDCPG